MTSDNGRYAAALLAALLSLASPLASHAQTAEDAAKDADQNAAKSETLDAQPEAAPAALEAAPQEAAAPPTEEKPAEATAEGEAAPGAPADTSVTGATDSSAGESKAAENQPAESKPAEEKPAEQTAAEEKPAEAAGPTPAAVPASDPAPVQTPAAAESPAPAVAPEPAPTAPSPQTVAEPEPEEPKNEALVIATPGGGYGQALDKAQLQPFAKETGRKTEAVTYSGGGLKDLEALKNQETSGKPAWDLISISGEAAGKACDEGLLRKIDPAAVFGEANAAAARNDFVPGAIQPCAIGSTVWSAVILFNKAPFGKNAPTTVKDLFDAAKFPGKRAFPKGGKYVLELALIADGVEPAKVYETLATEDGMARALAKLGQLKNDIVWWEKGQEATKLLASGKASMAVAFSGQAFTSAASRRDALGFIWDGQIYHFDLWAIPKGAKHPRAAREFINFATAPERLAEQTKWFPYGPARISALSKVGKHAELDLDVAPYLSTSPDNFKNALAFNGQWWAEHGQTVNERLEGWLKTAAIQPAATPAAAPAQKDSASDKKNEKEKKKSEDSEKPKGKSKPKPRERSAERSRDEREAAPSEGGRRASRDDRKESGRDSGRRSSRQTDRTPGNDRARDERGPERQPEPDRWTYPRDYMD